MPSSPTPDPTTTLTPGWPRWALSLPEDTRPPTTVDAFLLWLARRQWRSLAAGAVMGTAWMLPIALVPAAIGAAIDRGVVARDLGQLLLWAGAVLGLGIFSAVTGNGRHLAAVTNWLLATFRGAVLADRALRRAGPRLTRELPVGEIITSFSTDFGRLGGAFDVFARVTGSLVSFVVVAVILLKGSVLLGLIMLIGGPLLVLSLSLVMQPLQRRQEAQRQEAGALAALAADTVAGLRVLRGIGGEETFLRRYAVQSERVRVAGVRIAGLQATLDAAQVLLPGIFVLVVTAVGSRLVVRGEISPGQLVAFYGYTAFLTTPLRTVVEFTESMVRARVAARRVVRILAADPGAASESAPDLGPEAGPAAASVVRTAMGTLTGVVSADPEESAELVRGLAGDQVLVSEPTPHMFSGPLREELLAGLELDDPDVLARLDEVLVVADAEDVLLAVDGGLDGDLVERGRTLSGGQRQRIALARALVRAPELLVLIEPTSAVDAHTEARIAARLAEHRRGQRTIVVTASPLLLDACDEVLLVADGQVAARGRHHDLLSQVTAYREIVLRGEEP